MGHLNLVLESEIFWTLLLVRAPNNSNALANARPMLTSMRIADQHALVDSILPSANSKMQHHCCNQRGRQIRWAPLHCTNGRAAQVPPPVWRHALARPGLPPALLLRGPLWFFTKPAWSNYLIFAISIHRQRTKSSCHAMYSYVAIGVNARR